MTSPPVDGGYHITFNGGGGLPGTFIAQTFDTVVGTMYVVSFFVGRLGSGSGSLSISASAKSESGDLLGSLTAFPPSHGYGSVQTMVFTAASPRTTVQFLDTSTGEISSQDIALDNVTVLPRAFPTNSALSLDGKSGYVTIPDSPALRFSSGDFSICAWVWLNRYRSDNQAIATKREPGSYHGWMFYVGAQDPEARRPVFVVNGFADPRVVGNSDLGTNNWRHLAVVFHSAGSWADLYMNALLSGTALVPQPLATTTNLFLGQDTRGNPYFFDGKMDEISVWNKALTTNEIQSAMACRLTGFEPNLAAYYNFDGGGVTDMTGNGHNGTFVATALAMPIAGPDVIHQGRCNELVGFQSSRSKFSRTQGFRLNLLSGQNKPVRIDASTNLVDWEPVISFSAVSGSVEFIDPSATNFTLRFYRAVSPQ